MLGKLSWRDALQNGWTVVVMTLVVVFAVVAVIWRDEPDKPREPPISIPSFPSLTPNTFTPFVPFNPNSTIPWRPGSLVTIFPPFETLLPSTTQP